MENNAELNIILNELEIISEKVNRLKSSGKNVPEPVLELVESQLKNVFRTLEIADELESTEVKKETVAVAEETIPVDIKEVVGMSLENAATAIAAEIISEPAAKTDNTLAAKMKAKPIKDLKAAIGINEKFAFIKLFGGDANTWNEALQKLNSTSQEEATVFLAEAAKKFNWKEEDETLQILTELVQRRYL